MRPAGIEFRLVDESCEEPLSEFFRAVREAGNNAYYPRLVLTDEEARELARYSGRDLHYLLLEGGTALGYGRLRGWDEGYEIPSLGVIIRPDARGKGLGRLFMTFLHVAAERRGARRIMLKVHPRNLPARHMYEGFGYVFDGEEGGQLVGFVDV